MSQNLSFAAVVIVALSVNYFKVLLTHMYYDYNLLFLDFR